MIKKQIGWSQQANLLWAILKELKSIKPGPTTTTTTSTP
jgi:hypothetical protein